MDEPRYKINRTIGKKAQLEELWEINTNHELCIIAMKAYHSELLSADELISAHKRVNEVHNTLEY